MFHRKHSAGTKQKDKFRHRKAIHRIVSRPHNLKFPGGHDAFTNYLCKFFDFPFFQSRLFFEFDFLADSVFIFFDVFFHLTDFCVVAV